MELPRYARVSLIASDTSIESVIQELKADGYTQLSTRPDHTEWASRSLYTHTSISLKSTSTRASTKRSSLVRSEGHEEVQVDRYKKAVRPPPPKEFYLDDVIDGLLVFPPRTNLSFHPLVSSYRLILQVRITHLQPAIVRVNQREPREHRVRAVAFRRRCCAPNLAAT